jgi:hypothetical protein
MDGRQRTALLQISASVDSNAVLEKAATTLRLLRAESAEWDDKYHFDWLYPEVAASFTHTDAKGERRVNVLTLSQVGDVTELHALAQIIGSGKRVDVRTGIWILGRMLKLLMFVHPRGYSVQATPSKVLIHPGDEETRHQALIFDWCDVSLHDGVLPVPYCQRDIRLAVKSILDLLGADKRTGEYPYEDEHGFVKYIWRLTENDGDTLSIYEAYYRFVYDVFGQQYHPFTTATR